MNSGRPRIAFFDYPDVFEDFYPAYGLDQQAFATRWAATGSHAFITTIQQAIGDVCWYEFSLRPLLGRARHEVTGSDVRVLRSSLVHRALWHAFYGPRFAWRWWRAYPAYALLASYTASLSSSLFAALGDDRPDAIFVQDYANGRFDVLLAVARLRGIPLIAYHSGSEPHRYVGRMAKKWTIRHADMLIASSQREADQLVTAFRVPQDRVRVVLTPIDTEAFRPEDRTTARMAAGLQPDRRWILFVGRLDDHTKRVSALISAFAAVAPRHPDVHLAIAGDGPDAAALHAQAAGSGAGHQIRFLGWATGPRALGALYNSADCLVLPSRREGFPTVVGEAMACGTPVLATDVGAIKEMVSEGETGWLIEVGADHDLRDRLQWILENPAALGAMRPRVREMALRKVSTPVVADQLRACFGAVVQ